MWWKSYSLWWYQMVEAVMVLWRTIIFFSLVLKWYPIMIIIMWWYHMVHDINALGNDHPYVSFIPYSSPFYLNKRQWQRQWDKKNNGKDNEKTRSFRNHYIPPHHPDPSLLMLLSTCLSMDHWGMMPLKDSEFQRFPILNADDSSFLYAQFETELWR